MMNFWRKLQSPFALTLQGFAIGAIFLVSLDPLAVTDSAPAPSQQESILTTLEA